jgi:hypothetical protein
MTTSVKMKVPARVFTFLLMAISCGLQFLGKHLFLINVVVDPESISRVRDLTEEMVSTTMIITSVRF